MSNNPIKNRALFGDLILHNLRNQNNAQIRKKTNPVREN